MKGKKLLAGILSAAMVFSTMAFPAFADESNYVTIGDNTEKYYTLSDAISATKTEDVENSVITYNIIGKVSIGQGYVDFAKNVEKNTTIEFVGNGENAELTINTNDSTNRSILWNNSKAVTVNVSDLICSRENGCWGQDIAQLNQYFSICAKGNVTYTNCVFPDGVGAGYWKDTTFSGCTFKNDNGSEEFGDTYGLWFRGVSGNKVTVKDNCVFDSPKGIKTHSDDQSVVINAEISDAAFNCTDSPAIVASNPGIIMAADINIDNCAGGLARNDKGAEITVDGKTPAYTAKVGDKLYTDKAYAEKEAADKGTTVESIAAVVGDKYYSTVDEAVAAAQAATTDKWHIAKITLLTNDALDVSKGPDNYISYNITKNDTVITGERIADDAHKSYYKLTNASTLYIPADVSSLILENVKNLCRIELAKGADVTLKLNGDNELAGNIFVPEGAKLTIEDVTADGTGRLAVYNTTTREAVARGQNGFGAGDNYSAAIGGSQTQPGGEIVIKSGEIEAYSGYGAAIGGGQQKTAKVTILGGKIKAEASYAPAIGGGQQSIGDVTISGGVVDAKSDRCAAIGGGNQTTEDSNIIITGGDITVASDFGKNLLGNSTEEPAGAKISGGTFNVDVSDYCEDGFKPKKDGDKYVVNNLAENITVAFEPNGTDGKVYDIVLKANEDLIINRLTSVDLTFDFVPATGDAVTYEIKKSDNVNITPNTDTEGRYLFSFDGITKPDKTAERITIGQVIFDGIGQFTFKTKDVNSNIANATTSADNIIDSYFVGGTAAGKGELIIDDPEGVIDGNITVPTNELKVTVKFNNPVGNQIATYQNMKVTVSGGDLAAEKEFAIGSDENEVANGQASITTELTENIAYTVTVTGAGYRTARHTVTMSGDKTLTFWNNVLDTAKSVEEGKTAVTKNFLAGDIVKDSKINIYDLSAVVSYYGRTNDTATADVYAKYDLNRDGVIDSKDVSMVLVSWGE